MSPIFMIAFQPLRVSSKKVRKEESDVEEGRKEGRKEEEGGGLTSRTLREHCCQSSR